MSYFRHVKIDIERIDDLLALEHVQIVVDLLYLARKSVERGVPLTFHKISEDEAIQQSGKISTTEKFDFWVQKKQTLVENKIFEKLNLKIQ